MAEDNYAYYIIPDLRTWAFPKEYEQQTKIEYYSSFEDVKKRFDELRTAPYNTEQALSDDGQPSARLTLGVEKDFAAFDIIHVRAGENVLVTDFTRDESFTKDESLLAEIRKIAAEIGFDKVNHYPRLENGNYGKPSLVPFDKWAAENPQYGLQSEKTVIPFYDKPIAYAKANNEMDKWRDSFAETRRCADALQKLIADNHANMSLNAKNVVESAVAEFGEQRVSLVIASTIQMRVGDGRFSKANRDWANSIDVPQDGHHDRVFVNSHSCLIDGVVDEYKKFLLEETIAAEKTVGQYKGGTTMADHETTFEVSSMLKIDDGSKTKALANLVINGEIAINNVKVMEGANGNLNPVMPSKRVGNGYEDVVHATTTEAYDQIKNAVMSNYEKLIASGEEKLKNDLGLDKYKPAVSDIKVSLHEVKHDTVKAAGQIKIDDCFVINDVKVMKPRDPEKPLFVSMPSYPNAKGGYTEHALPITIAMHGKLNEEVAVKAYRNMEQVEYKGVKYAELGEKSEIASTPRLNNSFAEKLMGELDKAGIIYQARIGSNSGTVISVNKADKPNLDEIHKELYAALNPPKEEKQQEAAAPKQDVKPRQPHAKH